MGDIELMAGGVAISLGPDGDLAKCLQPGIATVLHFKDTLQAVSSIPNATLADVPSGSFSARFSTDQTATWTPSGTMISLSFRPELGGCVTFTKSGSVVTYLDGDENAFSVHVPDGMVYVTIAFQVSMRVGGGAAFSAGQFGVKANLSNDDTFTIANHRCFPATTGVFDALRHAFDGFTLPFCADGVRSLGPDDLLDFQFLGKLGLGFGLNYGYTGALLGGRSVGEISRSLDTHIATVAFKAKPTFTAGASFAMTYDHEDAFRFVIHRRGNENSATLTILKMDKDTLTTKATAGVTIIAGAKIDLQAKTEESIGAAVDHAFAGIDGRAGQVLKEKLKAAGNGIVDKITERASGAVNDLLGDASGKTGIELIHEHARTDAALFQLTFDLNDIDVLDGPVRLAMEGRIAEAAVLPGVMLVPGSLVEHEFHRRTALTFQFFDLWKWKDAVDYIEKMEVVYAGNGVLQLIGTEGVTHASGIVGHGKTCDVHFRATAKQGVTANTISDVELALCFGLFDQNTRDAEATCRLLRACDNDQLTTAAARAKSFMREHGRTLRTNCAFDQGVFQRFAADKYNGQEPPPLPHTLDSQNYAAFRDAVKATVGDWLGFAEYDAWAVFNRTATDREDSTRVPDRRHPGNLAAWPSAFANITDTAQRQFRRYWSDSAREFMNLIDDLGTLCQDLDDTRTEESFHRLLAALNGIIKKDIPVEFIKAVLLGLIKVSRATPREVAAAPDGSTMHVTFAIVGE